MRQLASLFAAGALVFGVGSVGALAQGLPQSLPTASPAKAAPPLPTPSPLRALKLIHVTTSGHGAAMSPVLRRKPDARPPRIARRSASVRAPYAVAQKRPRATVQAWPARGRDLGRFWPPVF